MIGLDTNVILRYLLQDDPDQTLQVNRIFERELSDQNPGFLNLATTLEIVWVLRSLLRQSPAQIALHMENLLAADSLELQNEQQVFEAVFALKNGTGEFEDALIGALNAWAGCSRTLTFDSKRRGCPHFKGSRRQSAYSGMPESNNIIREERG
jgi:predicted nucleic-acid-binding protein